MEEGQPRPSGASKPTEMHPSGVLRGCGEPSSKSSPHRPMFVEHMGFRKVPSAGGHSSGLRLWEQLGTLGFD